MGPQSFLRHWWNNVKPLQPAPVTDPDLLHLKRRQRILLLSTCAILALGGGTWGGYYFIGRAPQRASAAVNKGVDKMTPGSYDAAVNSFTQAIEISPTVAGAYLNRGIALHALGEREAALGDLDKALSLDATLTRAYDERGRIYLEKQDRERAMKEFSRSIDIRPSTDGYYQRGLLYESIGDHAKAVADYDKAIAETPDAPYAYRARALAKAGMGDAKGARQDRDFADRIEGIKPAN